MLGWCPICLVPARSEIVSLSIEGELLGNSVAFMATSRPENRMV